MGGVGTGVAIWWRGESHWKDMLARVNAVQKRLDASPASRPELWGDLKEGRAFDDYEKAVRLMAAVITELDALEGDDPRYQPQDSWELQARYWWQPATAPDAIWEIVGRLRPAFEHLHQGAHRRDNIYRIAWREGVVAERPTSSNVTALCHLPMYASLRAWQLFDSGAHTECAQLILDAMQFGHDYFSAPSALASAIGMAQMYASSNLFVVEGNPLAATPPTKPPVALEQLDGDARQLLEAGLARLDRGLPPIGDKMRSAAVLLARQVSLKTTDVSPLHELGSGESMRLLVAEAVLQTIDTADELDALPGDWPTRLARYTSWDRGGKMADSVVLKAVAPVMADLGRKQRQTQLLIRVLRMALSEANDRPLVLDDPFGGKIRRKAGDGWVHYWSVGADGVDDGGDMEKDIVFMR